MKGVRITSLKKSGPRIGERPRTIFEISLDGFNLIGATDQRALFAGFGAEAGQGVACDGLIEQAFVLPKAQQEASGSHAVIRFLNLKRHSYSKAMEQDK